MPYHSQTQKEMNVPVLSASLLSASTLHIPMALDRCFGNRVVDSGLDQVTRKYPNLLASGQSVLVNPLN